MDCDICSRPFGSQRPPLCVSCAQVALYERRIDQASSLLDRERHHAYAEAVVRPGNDGVIAALPEDADFDAITTSMGKHNVECSRAEQLATENRIADIMDMAEELKKQMSAYEEQSHARKDRLERRRKDLAAERVEFVKYQPRAMEPVANASNKISLRLEKERRRIVDARLLLCREAALAMNFHKRKAKDGRSEYVLGGIVIPDLRDLNIKTSPQAKQPLVGGRTIAEPYDQVSEAFDNVARLLSLCAYYLSVRLPGELLLPHENFPRAAIMSEKASYRFKDIRFPGISPSQSSSPLASRVIERDQPRPRPLWLDRPLGQLAKDSTKAYSLYIEGVTMLGYNIAWLCRTQGIDNINGFDDVCPIGPNLFRLLTQTRKSQHKPSIDRKATGTSSKTTATSGKEDGGFRLGVLSHNSAQHNLASAGGLSHMKEWKMGSSTRLADQLKYHLLTEISGAEWDYLEEREWSEEREDERPVLVGGSRRPQESRHAAAMSIMTVAAHDGAEDERSSASDSKKEKKGASGWMKVRGRSGDGS